MGTDVHGTAKPVLLLFQTDNPRPARAIKVCNTVDVAVTAVGAPEPSRLLPRWSVLRDSDVLYRRRQKLPICLTTSVSQIRPCIETGAKVRELLGYCLGDRWSYCFDYSRWRRSSSSLLFELAQRLDYGTRGDLIKLTGVTNKTSEVFKGRWDSGSSTLMVELLDPVALFLINATATLTLENGDAILVKAAVASTVPTVFVQLVDQGGETCVLSNP